MRLKTTATIPIFLSVIFILLYVANNFVSLLFGNANNYVLTLAIEIAVYIIPTVIFIIFRARAKKNYLKFISPYPPKISRWKISVSAAFLVTSLGMLYSFLSFLLGISESFSEKAFESANGTEIVLTLLLVVILPALFEEIVFRGIVLREYAKYGISIAVLFSSFCFAIFHFSISGFVYYFISGIFLAVTAEVTGSLWMSFLAHLLHNLVTAYGYKHLANLASNYSDINFLTFVSLFLSLVALFCFLTALDRHYAKLAETSVYVDKNTETIKEDYSKRLSEVFLSPCFLILFVIFVALSLNIL